jgi:putative ABC transport system substrate-binding protein
VARSGAAAFREALAKLGWSEGRNIRIDLRWTNADPEQIRSSVHTMIASQPELIVTQSTPSTVIE